ncbi:hypothetical protein Dimus_019124 [Dionaea muscipula]
MSTISLKRNLDQLVQLALERCNDVNQLKQLQAFLIKLGHDQNQFIVFKLVRRSVVSLANIEYARLIFNHLKSPNVYLYSSMLSAYASKSDHRAVLTLYKDMVRRGRPLPNEFIYPFVLKSSTEMVDPYAPSPSVLHSQIIKSGYGSNPVVQTALVDSYSRSSSGLCAARLTFDKILDKNVVSWTAMISGFARFGEIGNAILLFEDMPMRDVPSWNAIIAGCAQNGFFSEAIFFFRKMLKLAEPPYGENSPNQVTIACALSACGQAGMLQLGKSIHAFVFKSHLGSCSYIENSLLDMYGKCGSLKASQNIFDKSLEKNLTSWNSMINNFALHGQFRRALDLFEKMIQSEDGVEPDDITFVGLLNACTHGGFVERGYFYFDLMRNTYGIDPQIEHYGCLIDLLGRAGRFGEAMAVIRGMKIEADEVVWGSLLNGCKIHGNTELAELAVKKLINLNPNNGGYMAMLANLYVKSAQWDEAGEVRKMLREKNTHKLLGCSWIEVDGQVHQFNSASDKHPKTDAIYDTLESLFGAS